MSITDPPEQTAVSAGYWDATRRRELVVQWCPRCDRGVHYPRLLCPYCGADELGWRTMSGVATVHSHATHVPRGADPYCVALVDLDEGVRLLTQVVGIDPDAVTVAMPVRLDWHPLADGRNLPVFVPAAVAPEEEPR